MSSSTSIRYKSCQHQISKQPFIEAVGNHQGLDDSAWNLGKPYASDITESFPSPQQSYSGKHYEQMDSGLPQPSAPLTLQ